MSVFIPHASQGCGLGEVPSDQVARLVEGTESHVDALAQLPHPPWTFLILRTGFTPPHCLMSVAISVAARARKRAVSSSTSGSPSAGAEACRIVWLKPSRPPCSTSTFL